MGINSILTSAKNILEQKISGIKTQITNKGGNFTVTDSDHINFGSLPTDGIWTSICYGNGLFVAIGGTSPGSTTVVTADGVTWTIGTLPATQYWTDIAYGNGLFVAVVNGSNIAATSPDGINWIQRTLSNSLACSSIKYGGGLFVVVSSNDYIASTSPDGIVWTSRTFPNKESSSLVYGNNTFVSIVGYGNKAVTSTDGINWTQRSLPGTLSWSDITYGNGLFVAIASSSETYATSPDGINWTFRSLPQYTYWNSITYGNGIFVAIGTYSYYMATSPDGINWTLITTTIQITSYKMCYGNNKFIGVAPSALSVCFVETLDDFDLIKKGINSLNLTPLAQDDVLMITDISASIATQQNTICHGNNTFVSFPTSGSTIRLSPDGINWTARSIGPSATWCNVIYGNGMFVATSTTSLIATSPDGLTWTARTAPINTSWYYICYGNGRFVVVSSYVSNSLVSVDGINWTQNPMPSSMSIAGLAYGNETFVITEQMGNRILTSSDGINWTEHTAPISAYWRGLCFGNGIFVCVATNSSNVMTSSDGITWTVRTLPLVSAWSMLTYGNGMFIILADNNDNIATSLDGINWSPNVNIVSALWKSICYGNGAFVVLGGNKTTIEIAIKPIATTTDISTRNTFLDIDGNLGSGAFANPDPMLLNWRFSYVSNFNAVIDNAATPMFRVGWGNGIYVALCVYNGYFIAYRSIDGYTWRYSSKSQITATGKQTLIGDIQYLDGIFAVVISTDIGSCIYNSTNYGLTWTATTYTNTSTIHLMVCDIGAYIYTGATLSSTPNLTFASINTVSCSPITKIYAMCTIDSHFLAIGVDDLDNSYIVHGTSIVNYDMTRTATSLIFGANLGLIESCCNIVGVGNKFVLTTGSDVLVSYVDTPLVFTSYINKINQYFGFNTNFKINAVINGVLIFTTPMSCDIYTTTNNFDEFNIRTCDSDYIAKFSPFNNLNCCNGLLIMLNGPYVAIAGKANTFDDQDSNSMPALIEGSFLSDGTSTSIVQSLGFTPYKVFITMRGKNVAKQRIDEIVLSRRNEFGINGEMCNGYRLVNTSGDVITEYDSINYPALVGTITDEGFKIPPIIANGDVMIYDYTIIGNGNPQKLRSAAINTIQNYTLPVTTQWYAITYGNGIYVAVAIETNIAATSPDGISWTQRTLPATTWWFDICYGNGLFVAISGGYYSDSNIFATSADGITWTQRTAPRSGRWWSVCYENGLFVAIAEGLYAATSPDGINWTQRTMPATKTWRSVCCGNGLFVAISTNSSNIAATSPDGIAWTQQTMPATTQWHSVCYGNGIYVAVAIETNIAATSPDGMTWTQRTLPLSSCSTSLCYGNGIFMLTGKDYNGILISRNGIDWEIINTLTSVKGFTLTYGDGKFVTFTTNTNICTTIEIY